jgi:hypothetical protein
MQTVKILLLDIETAPSLGWVWEKYETNVIDFKSDWYMLSYAYKWLYEDDTKVVGLVDFPRYDRDRENDKQLVKSLWKLMDAADVIIAHNGDKFDIKKINTRFLTHGLKPPSPYKTVDTLKIARSKFAFDSNKLDDLGRYLGVGRKLPNTGFHLWKGCMIGDREAWRQMKEYNGHDVDLLERVYTILFPWDTKHPAVNLGQRDTCPKCGSSQVQRRGFNFTLLSKAQRYQCRDCAGWFAGASKRIK